MNLQTYGITEAAAGLREKKYSSRELTQTALDRLARQEPTLNAFITVTGDLALAQAEAVDDRIARGEEIGPLAGLPMAVKDNLMVRGILATAGSRMLTDYIAPYTATAVDRLLQAGAILVGKTNCDEYGMGGSGEHSGYGATRNPWDLERVPGGSSSGSAAAVAAGDCLYALGTDTGGSVRQPAGFCNLTGLKPTYGRVSRHGLIALASSFDHVGVLAKNVDDCAVVLQAIAGRDPLDSTSATAPVGPYTSPAAADISGLTIGVPKEFFVDGMDPNVERAVRQAIRDYERLGCRIVDVSIPHAADALAVYYLIQTAEASSNLARYDGIRYGHTAAESGLEAYYSRSRAEGFGQETKRRIMLGTFVLSAGYYEAYYLLAHKVRQLIAAEFAAAFTRADILITPTSPSVAFRLNEKISDPLTLYLADMFTCSANIAGLPALSVPAGWAHDLPVGVQLIAPRFAEARLCEVGRAYQRTTDWHRRFPGPDRLPE